MLVSLQEVVWWKVAYKDQKHVRKHIRALVEQDFSLTNGSKSLDGNSRHKGCESVNAQNTQEILNELENATEMEAFKLPPIPDDATACLQGKDISVSHQLVVKINTTIQFTNPEFILPVSIVPPSYSPDSAPEEHSPP